VVRREQLSPKEKEIPEQQKRLNKESPLMGTIEGSAGALLRVHLGPVVGSLMSLSVNDIGCLIYRCQQPKRRCQ
jgi:hypothetical protein